MPFELTDIGERIVKEMLEAVASRRQLHSVQCQVTQANLEEDVGTATPKFFEDKARLKVSSAGRTYFSDGAQTVDILCCGPKWAVAIECKLGDTRMTVAPFQQRFCNPCGISRHPDGRLTGSMVALLDRRLRFPVEHIRAVLTPERSWPLRKKWWLVIREQVWKKWRNPLPVQSARVLIFDDLVRIYGSRREFDKLVRHTVGTDFAGRWNLDVT